MRRKALPQTYKKNLTIYKPAIDTKIKINPYKVITLLHSFQTDFNEIRS